MKTLAFRACLLAICCTLFACQKDPFQLFGNSMSLQDLELGKNKPNSTKTSPSDTLLPHLTQRFVVDASQKNLQIRSNKGTIYHIPTDAFVRKDGSVVQNAAVTLFVREIHRPSEMILLDKPTNTEGGLLESFGEFHVTAFVNNEALNLRNGASIRIETPIFNKNTPLSMPLWDADTTEFQTREGLNERGQFVQAIHAQTTSQGSTWRRDPTSKVRLNSDEKLEFELTQLNRWKNCDVLHTETGAKTNVLVHFSQNFTPSVKWDDFSAVYFKPDGRNILIKFFRPILNASAEKQGFHSDINALPVGMTGKLVALTRLGNRLFATQQTITIQPNESGFMAVNLAPTEVTQSQFLALLSSLDN